MKITLVKKILADGSPCQKCADVLEKLESSGQIQHIDETLVADERNSDSPGMVLARELNVSRAPFFVVEHSDGRREVYTVYLKFVKEVLGQQQSAADEAREILQNSNDLDFL
ncbi:hypothetical protein ACXYTJ_05695 [Gilvimarinus sp. F26214L]|uniref:hypothetical protein n=1 Tax=Gilvimarinus sp. DZF01 TaxID=3461371 RepID=UPI0040456CAB